MLISCRIVPPRTADPGGPRGPGWGGGLSHLGCPSSMHFLSSLSELALGSLSSGSMRKGEKKDKEATSASLRPLSPATLQHKPVSFALS